MGIYSFSGSFKDIVDFCNQNNLNKGQVSLRHYGNRTPPITYVASDSDYVLKVLQDKFVLRPATLTIADVTERYTQGLGDQSPFA